MKQKLESTMDQYLGSGSGERIQQLQREGSAPLQDNRRQAQENEELREDRNRRDKHDGESGGTAGTGGSDDTSKPFRPQHSRCKRKLNEHEMGLADYVVEAGITWTGQRMRRYCSLCRKNTASFVCLLCSSPVAARAAAAADGELHCFCVRKGRDCIGEHMRDCHMK